MSCVTREKDLWQEAARLLVMNAAVRTGFWAFIFNYESRVCRGVLGMAWERQGAQEEMVDVLRPRLR